MVGDAALSRKLSGDGAERRPYLIRPSRLLAFCIALRTLCETDRTFPFLFQRVFDSLDSNKNASYAA